VVVYVLPGGERREIDADEGSSVMEAAVGNLVPGIVGECGGTLSCATCHV
jgi:2Fe-2S ferredoxin